MQNEHFRENITQDAVGDNPVYDAREFSHDVKGVHVADNEIVYWLYPDDPKYIINRGYSGANMDEIFAKMKAAGWEIEHE